MNRSTPGSTNSNPALSISKSIDGFLKFKTAEGLSQRTISSYEYMLNHWVNTFGDQNVSEVQASDLTNYLAWLRTEYKPVRFNGSNEPLSAKSIRNVWVTFRSFFGWLQVEFNYPNPAKEIKAPKFQKHPVETFTKEEVEKILKACVYSRESQTEVRKKFSMRRPSANRDQAIVLTLLDSGLRATELCSLTVNDIDLKTGKVSVRHGVGGGAKGGKGRTVYLGRVARKAVWRYLAHREDGDDPSAPLFISQAYRPFNKDSLRVLINRLGSRAEVKKTYPHKFRHTFAITYLRSGGDVFTLQSLLGHGSLDMVRHYAQIAEVDVEQAHRKASPADNMRL
ncbi:MAG: tyrosine-type recombinase/integrase [Anaerolineaceae bacterium]|nr:tyrosine-type recombinase/integrase [Anaerolineaceae bacterium]